MSGLQIFILKTRFLDLELKMKFLSFLGFLLFKVKSSKARNLMEFLSLTLIIGKFFAH